MTDKEVKKYLPMIRCCAKKILSKFRTEYLDLEDLISIGYIGLISAEKRYDKTKNVLFKTFAKHRVYGNMVDEIRKMNQNYNGHKIKKISRIEKDIKYNLTRKQIANMLYKNEIILKPIQLDINIDTLSTTYNLDDEIFKKQIYNRLVEIIDKLMIKLSDKKRRIIANYLYNGFTQEQCAEIEGLNQPRASQIINEYIREAKTKAKKEITDIVLF